MVYAAYVGCPWRGASAFFCLPFSDPTCFHWAISPACCICFRPWYLAKETQLHSWFLLQNVFTPQSLAGLHPHTSKLCIQSHLSSFRLKPKCHGREKVSLQVLFFNCRKCFAQLHVPVSWGVFRDTSSSIPTSSSCWTCLNRLFYFFKDSGWAKYRQIFTGVVERLSLTQKNFPV